MSTVAELGAKIDAALDAAGAWSGTSRQWLDTNAVMRIDGSPWSVSIAIEGIYDWPDYVATTLNALPENRLWLHDPINGYTLGIHELPPDYYEALAETIRRSQHA